MHNYLRSKVPALCGALALFVTATTGCSGGGGTEPAGGRVEAVTVTPDRPSVALGSALQLNATALSAERSELAGRSVVWASADSTVATVSADGVVTSKKIGSVQIQAAIEGQSAYAFVTVVARPVATVSVSPGTASVGAGATTQLQAAVVDDRGAPVADQPVVWRSSDDAVARVTSTGLVSGVAPGTATITAAAGEGKVGSASVSVTGAVAPPGNGTAGAVVARVSVQPSPTAGVFLGETLQLTATAFDAGDAVISGRTAAWTTNAPAVASVDNATGVVRGLAEGTATITLTMDGKTANTVVTVSRRKATSIEIAAPPEITVGQQAQLSATPRDVNGQALSGRTVTWASGNESVVTVNRTTGLAEARGAGTAVLTATVEGEAASSTTIIVKAASGAALKASFAYGCTNLTCAFTDSSSAGSSGVVSRWRWDFGNGVTSDFPDGDVVYSSGGSFTVTLTVTDNKGATASASVQVNVGRNAAPVVRLRNRATGTCLSIEGGPGGFPAPNTRVATRACDGGRDQAYSLPSGPGAGPLQLPRYTLPADPRYENGLFVRMGNASDGAPHVYHWIGDQEQRWIRVESTGEIRNKVTRTCLTAQPGGQSVGPDACGRGGTQEWVAEAAP